MDRCPFADEQFVLLEHVLDFLRPVLCAGVEREVLPRHVRQSLAGSRFLHRREQPFVGLADHASHRFLGLFQARLCLLGHQVVEHDAVVFVVADDAAPRQVRANVILQAAHAVVVRRHEDQTVLLEAGLVATLLENLGCPINGNTLAALAEGRVWRQHHQPQRPVVGHVAAAGEYVDVSEHAAGKTLLQTVADGGENVLSVLKTTLALLHFAPQVRARVQPEAVVSGVQVVQPVAQAPQRVLEQVGLLAGLGHAQDHPIQLHAAHA